MNPVKKAAKWITDVTTPLTNTIYLAFKFTGLEVPFLALVSGVTKLVAKRTSSSLIVSKSGSIEMNLTLKKAMNMRKRDYEEQNITMLRDLRKDFAKGLEMLEPGTYSTNVNDTIYRAVKGIKSLSQSSEFEIKIEKTYEKRQMLEKMMLVSNREIWKSTLTGKLPGLLKKLNQKETMHEIKIIKTNKQREEKAEVEVKDEKREEKMRKLELIEARNRDRNYVTTKQQVKNNEQGIER